MHFSSLSRQQSGTTVAHSLHSQISNAAIDYSPWMRQQRRPQKSATTTTTTAVGGLPRKYF